MASSEVTLGSITNVLLGHFTVRRSAIITTSLTGNPMLDEIRIGLARNAVVLQYEHLDEVDELGRRCEASLDLVALDPFHSYESSVLCLQRCLDMLRPGGVLLCHDCVPLPDTMNIECNMAPEWCGVTFAAFRDVMTARGAHWCTLAADYGIGLAVAPSDVAVPAESGTDAWTAATHDEYLKRYLADPFAFMRTVRAEMWRTAVDRLRAGGDVADLAAEFSAWDDLRPPSPAVPKSRSHRAIRRVLQAVEQRF